jgi:polysaccharide export outer membrane protein
MNGERTTVPPDATRQRAITRLLRAGLFGLLASSSMGATCLVRPQAEAPSAVDVPTTANLPPDPHAGSRFGPGDVFEVRLMGEPDLSGAYRVSPDGTFDFPFCGRLQVDGLLASDVASRLTGCLKDGKYFKDPQIIVIARDVGASRKIFVYGNVQKAGPYLYLDNMSIVEAIANAGGFAPFAGMNQCSVIRRSENDGKDQKFKVPVQDIGLGKAPNFLLRPGDIIFVPESAF